MREGPRIDQANNTKLYMEKEATYGFNTRCKM